MTDKEILYANILAAPEDDTPRLVYADYLEENGEEVRAKFIRDQISGLDVKPSIHWFLFPAGYYIQETWSRGFVSGFRCEWEDWRNRGSALMNQYTPFHPIDTVELTDLPHSARTIDATWREYTFHFLIPDDRGNLFSEEIDVFVEELRRRWQPILIDLFAGPHRLTPSVRIVRDGLTNLEFRFTSSFPSLSAAALHWARRQSASSTASRSRVNRIASATSSAAAQDAP